MPERFLRRILGAIFLGYCIRAGATLHRLANRDIMRRAETGIVENDILVRCGFHLGLLAGFIDDIEPLDIRRRPYALKRPLMLRKRRLISYKASLPFC